jgi:DNA-binding MarR family transcriptional regulator
MAELTDYTGYLLRIAFLRAAGLVPKTFPKGSHPRDASVLSTLEAVGPCSQQQLVDALHVNRSVMVKLIDGLEVRGLVERRRNPADRRSYALEPTAEGTATLRKARTATEKVQRALAEPLGPDGDEELRVLLRRLLGLPEDAA